jgi:hypothetical protein
MRNEPMVNQLNFFIIYGKYYIYCCKKQRKDTNLYEFLMECRKQLISKHEIMVAAVGEKKFHEQWGELYECML